MFVKLKLKLSNKSKRKSQLLWCSGRCSVCVCDCDVVGAVSFAGLGELWCNACSYLQAGVRAHSQSLWVISDCVAAWDGTTQVRPLSLALRIALRIALRLARLAFRIKVTVCSGPSTTFSNIIMETVPTAVCVQLSFLYYYTVSRALTA